MKTGIKRILFATAVAAIAGFGLSACHDDADIAQRNMTKAADNFEIMRRVVFYNAIRDTYMLEVIGLCSVEPGALRLSDICKTGPDQYKRHFLGYSDNAPYFVEQLESVPVNVYHYRVTFKPQSILPDVDFRGDAGAALDALTPDAKD